MEIQKDVSLKEFTTFRIGGSADFFVCVQSVSELKKAITYAQEHTLKVFILGSGSNIVFKDEGFRGLVIKIEIKGVVCNNTKGDGVILEVGGGEVFDELISYCVKNNYYGLENLSAIPGTVGASPVQNIGAYGVEVKDLIKYVDTINIHTCKTKRFTKSECKFVYRDSFFKTEKGKEYVIIHVCFKLKKQNKLNLSYSDLAKYFRENKATSLTEVREAIINIRRNKFPDLDKVGTAGSFFKNPIVTDIEYSALQGQFESIPSYRSSVGYVKIPLGFILEKLGWKGREYKQLCIYDKQALVIVNKKNATAKQLNELSNMIEKDVMEKTGIKIEKEVTFV